VVYPRGVLDCTSCHAEDAAESHVWYTRPSRDACGSCHDQIDWVSGEGHVAGPATDDSACAECHQPEGEFEFDASIMGAHTIPTRSRQLAGLNVEILDLQQTAPGERPLATFKLTNGDGSAVDPASLDRMRFLFGGPNREYSNYYTENAGSAQFDGDVATYQFETPVPDDADGTWTLTADVYRNVTIQDSQGEDISVREAAFNPIFDAPVTDASPFMRREIVSLDKCNDCHGELALHGSQRLRIEECVICHNPESDDSPVRPEDAGLPESVHFKYMIHRIHKGEELAQDFTVYGFRSSVHNYNEVLYPGDLRNCESCHLPGTYGVPIVEEARATVTQRDWYSPMLPAASACLSCHDGADAAAHAFVNTAPFGEACGSCHGDNREFSVEKSHSR
jgi:OmcA/MtrC family decaheme c-type cytochrome